MNNSIKSLLIAPSCSRYYDQLGDSLNLWPRGTRKLISICKKAVYFWSENINKKIKM